MMRRRGTSRNKESTGTSQRARRSPGDRFIIVRQRLRTSLRDDFDVVGVQWLTTRSPWDGFNIGGQLRLRRSCRNWLYILEAETGDPMNVNEVCIFFVIPVEIPCDQT